MFLTIVLLFTHIPKALNHWVYFDRKATCNVEVKYTLEKGNTVVLEDGCGTGTNKLYPAVIEGTFLDSSAPVPKINGEGLPQTILVTAAGTGSDSAIVTFEASAVDDCDANPIVTVSHSSHSSGSAFPLGDTVLTVTATDNKGNKSEIGYLTVTVIRPPTSTPSKAPTQRPITGSPTKQPTNEPTDQVSEL